jgi:phenylacetate-CoA ligase
MATADAKASELAGVPEHVWLRRGRGNALAAFRRAARSVPAYRAFLREHSIVPSDIRTFDDFLRLPTTSKENYLLRHDLVELMPGGRLDGACVVTRSSGYSGEPIFWPTLKRQSGKAILGMEAFYSLFGIAERLTLALVTFALSSHSAGQSIVDASLHVARKPRSRLTVATPGASVEETLDLVRHLSPRFEQTVIWGYPSLIHKIVVAGADSGTRWADLNAFAVCSGEGFGESWRRLMVGLLGGPPHPMRVSALYGSADAGLMGFDTPVSLLVRQLALDHRRLQEAIFRGRPPAAFVQFSPVERFFETVEGELTLTCWRAIPMIRYVVHDVGDVIPFSTLVAHLRSCGISLEDAARADGVAHHHIWPLPFLSCFGRSDGTVSVVGANVYPHTLQHVFAAHKQVSHFKLAVEQDAAGLSRLTVYVEWAGGELSVRTRQRFEHMLHAEVREALLQANWDYRGAMRDDPVSADPRIVLVPRGSGPFVDDADRWKRSYTYLPGERRDSNSGG